LQPIVGSIVDAHSRAHRNGVAVAILIGGFFQLKLGYAYIEKQDMAKTTMTALVWVCIEKSGAPCSLEIRDDGNACVVLREAKAALELPLGIQYYNLFIKNRVVDRAQAVETFAAETSPENPAIIRDSRGNIFTINLQRIDITMAVLEGKPARRQVSANAHTRYGKSRNTIQTRIGPAVYASCAINAHFYGAHVVDQGQDRAGACSGYVTGFLHCRFGHALPTKNSLVCRRSAANRGVVYTSLNCREC
jgi:hypothetical protein